MIKSLALIGTLTITLTLVLTSAFASQPLRSRQIVCVETGSDSETHVISKIGEITVTLDKKGQPQLIHINRQGHSDVPSINKTFDVKSSTIKNNVQMISASDSDRRSLVLKINDQFQSGEAASSYTYEYGKMQVSSAEETTVLTCEGDRLTQTHSPSAIALDQQPKMLLDK